MEERERREDKELAPVGGVSTSELEQTPSGPAPCSHLYPTIPLLRRANADAPEIVMPKPRAATATLSHMNSQMGKTSNRKFRLSVRM